MKIIIANIKHTSHAIYSMVKGSVYHRKISEYSGKKILGINIVLKTHFIGCECGKVFYGEPSKGNPYIK